MQKIFLEKKKRKAKFCSSKEEINFVFFVGSTLSSKSLGVQLNIFKNFFSKKNFGNFFFAERKKNSEQEN
jgi:hypothetical protein